MNYYCRHCKVKCHRHGKSGKKQRWKCKACGITQFRVYKPKSINQSRETVIKRLNGENVGIRGIGRLLSLNPTHIIRSILKMATLIKRPQYYEYG